MTPLVFRAAAQREFDEAAKWYEDQRPGLGCDFVAEVERGLSMLVQEPYRFPIVIADIRVTLVRKFPYAIYFRVKRDRIIVLAVFHSSRDPKVWQSRT